MRSAAQVRLHIAFHRRDLALQLASIFKRDCKLLLKLTDIGVGSVDAAQACEAIMYVESDQQAEGCCRNKNRIPKNMTSLGHDTAL